MIIFESLLTISEASIILLRSLVEWQKIGLSLKPNRRSGL